MDFYFNNGQQTWDLDSPPSSSSFHSATRSDEELLLASSCPKKRAGRKKFKETRHPVYRGVRKRNNNKWVCELRAPSTDKGNQYGSRIWLGTYPTAEMAARAHDVAALALRGRLACLNFADSVSLFLVPQSGDIKEIQKAAAQAAEAFRPPEDVSSRQDTVRTPEEDDDEEEEEEEEAFTSSEEKEKAAHAETAEEEMVQESFTASYANEGTNIDMHNTILQMSQGTLLSPPHHHHGGDASWERPDWIDMDTSDQFQDDVSLWSWSSCNVRFFISMPCLKD